MLDISALTEPLVICSLFSKISDAWVAIISDGYSGLVLGDKKILILLPDGWFWVRKCSCHSIMGLGAGIPQLFGHWLRSYPAWFVPPGVLSASYSLSPSSVFYLVLWIAIKTHWFKKKLCVQPIWMWSQVCLCFLTWRKYWFWLRFLGIRRYK